MELAGLVAVLSEDGKVVEDVRDLGHVPVAVKAGRVVPLVDDKPALQEGQEYGAPTIVIAKDSATRTWLVRNKPTNDETDTATLNSALSEPGSVVRALAEMLFIESKARRPALTKQAFVTEIKARMRG